MATSNEERSANEVGNLGQTVLFWDRNGLPKTAIVTGTPQSIVGKFATGECPEITDNTRRHLMVMSPSLRGGNEAKIYTRHGVPQGEGAGYWAPLTQAQRRDFA